MEDKSEKKLIAHLSLTNACNFLCTICPSMREDKKYSRPRMTAGLLDRVLLEVLPDCSTLILGGNSLGEVTTHSEFGRFLADSFNPDNRIRMRLTTNGYRLGELSSKLARKFSFVSISFDGATKGTYEAIRKYPYEKIVANIKKLNAERVKEGTELKIGLGMTLLYDNLHELPALVELASSLGVDMVAGSYFIPNFPSERYQCLYYHQRYANDIAEKAEERAWLLGVEFRMPRFMMPGQKLTQDELRPVHETCPLPSTMVNISETGVVTPCCANPTIMGDLSKQSFEEVWNGKKYSRFREDPGANHYCRICHTPVFGKRASTGVMLDPSYQIKTIGTELGMGQVLCSGLVRTLSGSKTGLSVINFGKSAVGRK
ncbi:MAG: SPASM domain-containing protein [Deltaproteobacteria bacterium]|nr:SPASM domain-containing protein [Deltaproteobacteria bacterium]